MWEKIKYFIKQYWLNIKEFLAEYEIFTSVVFFGVVVFSYPLINKVFFTVEEKNKNTTPFDAFYYATFTLFIWAIFWLVVWLWTQYNFPEIAKTLKNTKAELSYIHAFIFLSIIYASLVGVGIMVFP